ncbi:DUF3131 domain-containing protein, partial [Candidatus Bathyarchaeota archaeon]|nr:DUF3131 domain-containing protein [Candidatus Bathyarchaeota archaeon]
MKREIANYRDKINLFIKKPTLGHAFLRASLDGEPKKTFFKNPWHFSKKAKYVIGFVIIAVLLVSIFAFLPKENQTPAIVNPQSNDPTAAPSPTNQPTPSATNKPNVLSDLGKILNTVATGVTDAISPPKGPGVIESAQTIDKNVWKAVGANAWNYFQPDVGVDSSTGLPSAGLGWPYFTDWDLGVYIQAVIDANKTGLIGSDGDWGSSARLDKVLTFLEHRDLNNYSYPFWFYQAKDGENFKERSDLATGPVDAMDTGRLFVALSNLREFNSNLAPRINSIVNGTRPNYAALLPGIRSENVSNSIYAYYMASGFASFWPEVSDVPAQILDNIVNGDPVKFDGNIYLPKSRISCEPLLNSIFELKNNPKLVDLAKNVYLAHEAKYNASKGKKYVAFSEGNSGSGFIYEWVVLPDGRTWTILDSKNQPFNINPIIYTKIAISFLALYNTTFAYNMVVYLRTFHTPVHGYREGVDESGVQLTGTGSNTNGLI